MSFIIPTSNAEPLYTQITSLDGADYVLTFALNSRDSKWYLDVADQDGDPIIQGLKLVEGWDLLHRCVDPRKPQGLLALQDVTGQGADPGPDDLGTRVVLRYYPVGETD